MTLIASFIKNCLEGFRRRGSRRHKDRKEFGMLNNIGHKRAKQRVFGGWEVQWVPFGMEKLGFNIEIGDSLICLCVKKEVPLPMFVGQEWI